MAYDENEATTSFLMQLSTWDKEELDAQLANRVQVSKRAVAKVLQAFDRLQQRNDKIWRAIKGEGEGEVSIFMFIIYTLLQKAVILNTCHIVRKFLSMS
ncbi:hypothetical protein MSG28_003236 [Choristoneura fumiferana]|uniref:Uncharacterized protein n=1 Tax=Choristoneura fumiferana TaxID=7141 RepID=A0ACC0KEG4_CHOFU|nr:hypothetical protein MSG28_003236 [Choristoneura fumiferana]